MDIILLVTVFSLTIQPVHGILFYDVGNVIKDVIASITSFIWSLVKSFFLWMWNIIKNAVVNLAKDVYASFR